jgi:hypothetical protein
MLTLLFLLWGFAAGTDNLPAIKEHDFAFFAGKKWRENFFSSFPNVFDGA